MRLLVPKHRVINNKIILGALVFLFLYAIRVNKDVVPLVSSPSPFKAESSKELVKKTILLHQLRVENEEKEKTLANSIHESPKSNH